MTEKTLTTWVKATRPQFFTVIILPILLGTAIAWRLQGVFVPIYFALSLLAGIFIQAGTNVLNDYFDHLNQTDEFNHSPLTPFAGGSRMIQNNILTVNETYWFGLILVSIAIIIGSFLVSVRGLPLLWIGLFGVLSGYFYSAPPFSLVDKGIGELLIGLNFGILAVLGAYYVQTQTLSPIAVIASLPLAALVTAILYINEFPDHNADKQAGKNNLVVRFGLTSARPLYAILIGLSFIVVAVGVIFESLPLFSLTCLLALPLGFFAIKSLYNHYDKPTALVPAIKNTIMLHTLVSSVLIVAFLL
ncbi:1,4-dihydroxy-2-naphthoate octaprenyltransferase [Candidatus Halobeggiatoa sp. HSG11]|nr:1,4-dihydroxy-2-naphthoate octaprenyltransferase [Candidatus Halobeggiatoa sp. HSG11]